MAQPNSTTTRRPSRCSKHAFAPPASWRPRNDGTPDVTLPAHRHQSCLGRVELALESPAAGDDPVNSSDPSGLASGCDSTNAAQQAACIAAQRAAAAANGPHCPAGSRIVGGQCTGTGAGQPCPSVNSTTGACNSAAWNANNPYGAGEVGLCVGGGLVTPWGGVIGSVCLVTGNGQIGVTATGAAGCSVRGLCGGIGVSGMSSAACSIHDLGGAFSGGAFGTIVTPWGGSYLTGHSANGPVNTTGVEVGYGGDAGGDGHPGRPPT